MHAACRARPRGLTQTVIGKPGAPRVELGHREEIDGGLILPWLLFPMPALTLGRHHRRSRINGRATYRNRFALVPACPASARTRRLLAGGEAEAFEAPTIK